MMAAPTRKKKAKPDNRQFAYMAPAPGTVKLAVNAVYPKDQPLGTVPPNVLEALPELPEGVEFRFVDRYLALRDAESNLIIDFMPAAIPAK